MVECVHYVNFLFVVSKSFLAYVACGMGSLWTPPSCCVPDSLLHEVSTVPSESKASVLISLTTSLLFVGRRASHGERDGDFIDPATVRLAPTCRPG